MRDEEMIIGSVGLSIDGVRVMIFLFLRYPIDQMPIAVIIILALFTMLHAIAQNNVSL